MSNKKIFPHRILLISIFFVLLLILLTMLHCSNNKEFCLVQDGKSDYVIVLSDDASHSEKYAAHELQIFLDMAAKAKLPVVNEADPRARKPLRIFVGSGKISDSVLPSSPPVDWEYLGDEGFIIRTITDADNQPDIIIAGGRLRGTLYGVYTFLNRLGFRWYTERKTVIPEADDLYVPHIYETAKPAFPEREIYFFEAANGDWAARNKINTRVAHLAEKHGGKVRPYAGTSINKIIPYSMYREHPEYFPLIGRERTTGYVQRCLSNPDVIRLSAEKILELVKEKPDYRVFSIHQSDIENLCECPSCKRIVKEHGAASALDIYYLNIVSELIETEYPDIYLSTLAYRYAQKPPENLKPRHNVMIRLCPIEMCLTHPFTECPSRQSKETYEALRGWTNLTSNVKIWHYGTNFSFLPAPMPNFREFPTSIREYQKHGIKGIFYQGQNNSPGSSDADLRSWVLAQLMWDPGKDGDELVDEWLHGVYNTAYVPMRAYFDLIHRQADSHHLHIKTPPSKKLWPRSFVSSMDSLHKAALALAKGDSIACYYIGKSRIVVKYLQYITNTGQLQVFDGEYRPDGNMVTEEDFNRFKDYALQFNVTVLGENDGGADLETRLRRRTRSYPAVTLENDNLIMDVVPELGGRIVRLIYKKTGTDILNNDPATLHYPSFGGYEEMEELVPGHVGFFEPYTCSSNGKSLTLSALTSKGLLFTRTIKLQDSSSCVSFISSITNKTKKAATFGLECRMHIHADLDAINLTAKNADGDFTKPTASDIFNIFWPSPSVGYRFDGANKPSGAWRLSNISDGLMIENRFIEDQVKWCRLVKNNSIQSARMEIHSPTREVPPEGTITIEHEWEIK